MNTNQAYEADLFSTSEGELKITFLGHGSLLFEFKGMHIYVDPYGKVADYASLAKADLVFLTHEHLDHLDPQALEQVKTRDTTVVQNERCSAQNPGGVVMRNGESQSVMEIPVEAVPVYNLVHKRPDGQPFHPKGVGNGYILTFGDLRVYVAGDTEDIPEMEDIRDIDIAFLPMNLPYTMTPEMAANAAQMVKPKILYPYHYGETDTSQLVKLLQSEPGIEVRIRKLK